jgi:hypothetical protein
MRCQTLLAAALLALFANAARADLLTPVYWSMDVTLGSGAGSSLDSTTVNTPAVEANFGTPTTEQDFYGVAAETYGPTYIRASEAWNADGTSTATVSLGSSLFSGLYAAVTSTGNTGGYISAAATESFQIEIDGPPGQFPF